MRYDAMKGAACAVGVMLTGTLAAGWFASDNPNDGNTVYRAQVARMKTSLKANAKRVADAAAEAKLGDAKIVPFAVPAMSDVMRLADTYPEDGGIAEPVRVTLAQGEFEAGSFELFSFADLEDVRLEVSPLTNGKETLEADLRVVKVWLQNGNAWVSYFDDAGLKLVPELLLHDENLVEVDDEKIANYARVMKNGRPTKVWISAPKKLEVNAFDPYDEGFRDADRLRPVRLNKNEFKQFFLTLHAKRGQAPGVYRGTVTVAAGRQSPIVKIPVAACVLPFELPLPRGYRNYDRLYFYGAMGAEPNHVGLILKCGGKERGDRCFRNWMQSLYDHSVFHAPSVTPKNIGDLPLLKEIGFPLNPVLGDHMQGWFGLNFGGRMSFSEVMQVKFNSARCKAFYDKHLPGSEVWCGHGDEQGAAFVTAHRELYDAYNEKGIKIGCAGHAALLYKGGYAYGFYPMAGTPDDVERARPWTEIKDVAVGFYASQHTGSENPQFVRLQHGMLGYLSGLTMTFNYEFAVGSWNDRADDVYKPMVITYSNGDGLMETLAYAGFREGCDDIRYATCLKGLCREAEARGSLKAKNAARIALQYLALLDRGKMDLNAIREEMIEHILKIRKELGK